MFLALRMIYDLCLFGTCLIGFRRGGASERAGSAIILIASVMTVVVEQLATFDWRGWRLELVVVDLLTLAALLILALRSRRFWPLWATSFHLIAVCSHLMAYIEPRRILQAYALMQGFWAYPIMLAIVIGAQSHHTRLQMKQRLALAR